VEPTKPREEFTGIPVQRLRPLGHLSASEAALPEQRTLGPRGWDCAAPSLRRALRADASRRPKSLPAILSNPRNPVKSLLEFQSSAFDRSATSPHLKPLSPRAPHPRSSRVGAPLQASMILNLRPRAWRSAARR